MKFILMLEESGYQIRFWNEIEEKIGESIATSWNKKKLYEKLINQGFNISKSTFEKSLKELDDKKSFVVLKSESRNTSVDLDTFINDQFTVEEDKV